MKTLFLFVAFFTLMFFAGMAIYESYTAERKVTTPVFSAAREIPRDEEDKKPSAEERGAAVLPREITVKRPSANSFV